MRSSSFSDLLQSTAIPMNKQLFAAAPAAQPLNKPYNKKKESQDFRLRTLF